MSQALLRRAAVLVCGLTVLMSLTAVLDAHEIGTTRVSVLALDAARFEIEVVTDAAALLEKVETVAGETPSGETDPSAIERHLERLGSIFQRRVAVSFDGARVEPSLSWTVAAAATAGAAPIATLQLTGEVPASAQALTWKYSWTFTSYAFADRRHPDHATTQWLDGERSSTSLSVADFRSNESRLVLLRRYIVLGFTHILPKGLDHVLFVLGIFLLSRRIRPILLQVTAFTIAHSITLALSIYGVVSLPASIVEPAIALSIAYIAIENVFRTTLGSGRLALVFGFGLLHGLGFAGVLRDVGLPQSEFMTALVGFNIGVELGQLTVIAAAFLLVGFWFQDRAWYRARLVVPASIFIACLGLYWTLERLSVFA